MIYEHVGITASDLDRSIDFYTKVFDFKILKKTAYNAYLYHGEDMLEIMQGAPDAELTGIHEEIDPMELLTNKVGLNHFGLRVENMEQAMAKFEELSKKFGGKVIVPPFEYKQKLEEIADIPEDKLRRVLRKEPWLIAVVTDPDGIPIEIQER
jgi:catechol 2,3-dioxygenase-like lactoylglutathione lyase family enzyme